MPKKKRTTKPSPLVPRRLKRRPRLDPMKALEQFVGSGDAPLELILKIARESDPTRLGFPWEIVNEPPKKERQ
ncbi:hypothetical protein [Fervidibacter sacchari]|jgi:hypothetical protein|uniref:Uncharacterized protein n=1 Tax=Candidatus Fervidibacter sacchari TaxID=1448929 RepID=A0ABT2EPN3_9BACT|nr:hypothetical protein [Candidatus Fervidibacter sacchari]MCS3919923.1 hypothetical protein [Candidatus Fervidibacter sacchari]WKU16841.1 hypothetical protein Q2T83_03215 [Candidatus Fervidibacter sacchari]